MTGRRLLVLLFALALLAGLLPGMDTAARAADGDPWTVTQVVHGNVTVQTDDNKTITVTATPDAGYRLKSVKAYTRWEMGSSQAIYLLPVRGCRRMAR